jgi:hypothetical protein
MTTLAIVFGAVSVLLLVTGFVALVRVYDDNDALLAWVFLSLGSIGLWLCLTI